MTSGPYHIFRKTGLILALMLCILLTQLSCTIEKAHFSRFAISFDETVRPEQTSGRFILMLSKTRRFSPSETGTPVFGLNIDDLDPGEKAFLDETVLGYPVKSLKNLPAGNYYVQCYLNVYTTFERSDGHVVKLHMDQGEGQSWRRSPGNLFSNVDSLYFDPEAGNTIDIVLNNVIPPIPPYEDTEWVKHVKIQSDLLTEFWGQPMHITANILLPKGYYEHPNARYPVLYRQGHFPRGNPGFREDPNSRQYQQWMAEDMPRFIQVTIDHACPYYDDSYGVNSENCGPYGDAIVEELIPEVERRFRAIGKPYGRVLTGGSTGGWISIAMQVWYPDFFGGTWTFYPDQVDFRKYQIVNIYDDKNAYFFESEWTKVPRPSNRNTDGNIRFTMEQENLKEEVLGDRYRSGGQWAIWNAVFAPVADDGYPKPIWDPLTGEIDHETAQWAMEHFDIRYYLEKNWSTVGPKLIGKIHVYCGRMDNYYLNEACYLLEEFLESTQNPYYAGEFQYGARGRHGWSPFSGNELMKAMAGHITENAPAGENTNMWKYR
ncbi:alpha/beta hydrolase-fold protein [candidate division KSB1 bacterium]